MSRLSQIRKAEAESHKAAYENLELYAPGSWLSKPVKALESLLPLYEECRGLRVLDPQFEVNLPPREARALLEKNFPGWQILWDKCIHYEYEVPRGSRLAMICAEVVTFTARRPE